MLPKINTCVSVYYDISLHFLVKKHIFFPRFIAEMRKFVVPLHAETTSSAVYLPRLRLACRYASILVAQTTPLIQGTGFIDDTA